jgi:hypothetical protein
LIKWYDYVADATARVNRPLAYRHDTRQMLQTAGFIDIREDVIRAPLNGWPSDPHQKQIGRWYSLGLTDGLEALSLAPLTRVYRWSANEHVRPMIKQVKKEIAQSKIHAYNNMYVLPIVLMWHDSGSDHKSLFFANKF